MSAKKRGLMWRLKSKQEAEMAALFVRVVNASANYREAAKKLGVSPGHITWMFQKNGVTLETTRRAKPTPAKGGGK